MILSNKRVAKHLALYLAIQTTFVVIALAFVPEKIVQVTRPTYEIIARATDPICEAMLLVVALILALRYCYEEEEK